jgi:hypothetical protein
LNQPIIKDLSLLLVGNTEQRSKFLHFSSSKMENVGHFNGELKHVTREYTLSASDIFSRVKEYFGDASLTSQI